MKRILTLALVMVIFEAKAQWSAVGGIGALNDLIATICTDAAGNIYAGGRFSNSSGNQYVAKWTKATNTWSELGGNNSLKANGNILSIILDKSGNLYASGGFTNATGYYVAKWDGTSWSELGGNNGGANGSIGTLCLDASGNIYAGGSFTDGTGKNFVVKWDGTSWSELGGTTLAANGSVNTICTDPSGNIYAAGAFRNSSGKWYVAEWNGSSWSEVGGTNALAANGGINTICSDKSGNIYAGGNFNIPLKGEYVAKWDGTSWSKVEGTDSLVATSGINSLITDSAGNLYTASLCGFGANGSFVGRWNGSSWTLLSMQSFPTPINGEPYAITFDSTGNLYIAGSFDDPNTFDSYVAEYSGSTLPIQFLSFNATAETNNVLLRWQTAQEENSDHFDIQRSIDGKNFITIAKVAAAGNSSVTKDYVYTDQGITALNSSIVFYRLGETDIDGAVTYSAIKEINMVARSIQFSVYPNPAKDYINLVSNTGCKNVAVKVTDENGKMLFDTKQNFEAGQQLKLSLSQFPAGVLIINISNYSGNQQYKIIKQ